MVVSAVVLGQPADNLPGYKVAVVTPNTEKDARPQTTSIPPSPLVLSAFTLRQLIARASRVPRFQVIGGPEWVDTIRWNFRLETDPVIMPTEKHDAILLRAIEDRFQLGIHRENKVMPVYELAVADSGSKLRPDPWFVAADPDGKLAPGSIHRRNSSIEELAKLLAVQLGRPVLDKTYMPGLFAFALDWSPDPGGEALVLAEGFPAPTAQAITGIVRALQEQLGLRLTPSNDTVEVIVIDGAAKPRMQ